MFKFVVEKLATEYKWKVNLSIYSSILLSSKTSISDTDYLIYLSLLFSFTSNKHAFFIFEKPSWLPDFF